MKKHITNHCLQLAIDSKFFFTWAFLYLSTIRSKSFLIMTAFCHIKYKVQAGEEAQWLRETIALAEDWSSVSSTHVRWLTTYL